MIRNIRMGLATNSSSTHSIIHTSKELNDSDLEDGMFGWNFFTASSKQAKKDYMFINLLQSSTEASRIMSIFSKLYDNDDARRLVDGYVDHESELSFPKDVYGLAIEQDFFLEITHYLVENNFSILGGNDNDSDSHPLSGSGDGKDAKTDVLSNYRPFERTYKNNNYWVMYRNNGDKARVAFHDEELTPNTPELVDIKITDYCDMGCSFCYQGSTEKGNHCSIDSLKYVRNEGYPSNSLEFAIGGGEPTTHPKFTTILKILSNSRMNYVNFTTRSKRWFNDEDIVKAVNEFVSGVAYSVSSSIDEVSTFLELHTKHINDVSMYIHIIPELMGGADTVSKFLNEVGELNKSLGKRYIKVTMLGFKEIGRGEGVPHKKIDGLIDLILKSTWVDVGIDTKIAIDYKSQLDNLDVSKKLYTSKEGEFSMYYDAVEKKAYKSSYEIDNPVLADKSSKLSEVFKEIRRS